MVDDITKGFKLTTRDYENMTDLINPSELKDDEITIDSLSDKIIVIRQQLLGLEDLLKKYINLREDKSKMTDEKQLELELGV